jgi:hypothetical protein
LVAVGLGLAEAAPDLCGYRPPGQGAEYLIGYWLWLASMAVLAALGLVARLGGADHRDADPFAEGSTPAGRVS